jgi:hypothetical protein
MNEGVVPRGSCVIDLRLPLKGGDLELSFAERAGVVERPEVHGESGFASEPVPRRLGERGVELEGALLPARVDVEFLRCGRGLDEGCSQHGRCGSQAFV